MPQLMTEEDYKHTWVIPRNAWYIKIYVWMWMAQEEEITFCKLFWGYALCWIGLPVRIVVAIVSGPLKALENYVEDPVRKAKRKEKKKRRKEERDKELSASMAVERYNKRREQERLEEQRKKEKEARKAARKLKRKQNPSFMQRRLNNVANGGVRVVMFFKNEIVKDVMFIVTLCVFTVGVLGGASYGVYEIVTNVTNPGAVGAVLIQGLIYLGAAVALVSIITGITFLVLETAFGLFCKLLLWDYCCRPIGTGVGKGALTFRDVMRIGYKSVKGNTCPRVVVGSVQDESKS